MSKVMDLTVVCNSFPPPIMGEEIIRESSLDTIEQMIENGIQLVIAEGCEGIGKSVLLTQFVKNHPDTALSLWVKPTHRSIDVFRADLCNQMAWALKKRELDNIDEATDQLLKAQASQLSRKARTQKYFFVLDGLLEIPEQEAEMRRILIDMLPWGYRGFHFIISGSTEDINLLIPAKIISKTLPVSRFRLDQTKKYFADLLQEKKVTDDEIRDLHDVCQQLPHRLASARRLIESGTLPSELQKKSNLYSLEWEKVTKNSDRSRLEKLLAVISYGYSPYGIAEIAGILGESAAYLENLLINIDFVRKDEQNQSLIFTSESFRRFAAEQVVTQKKVTQDAIIDYLYKQDNSSASQQLPHILAQAGRQHDLLNYLSLERLIWRLENSQSLFALQQEISLGLSAAKELSADNDIMRFMMHRSTLTQLNHDDVWRSEIEAKIATEDYEAALLLAQSAVLKVDRLRLLAVVARKQQQKSGISISQDVIDQIKHLYSQLDVTDYSDKAIEIAGDLIFVDPELAIDLVEKNTQTDFGENSLDVSIVKLYANTLTAEKGGWFQSSDSIEKIRNHVNSSKFQSLATATTILIGDYSASKVIQEVEEINKTSDRAFLLRLWLTKNREREDAIDVVDYAVNLIIRETSYSPNARVLRELASPLPYVQNIDRLKKSISTFSSQATGAKIVGPTQDYIRLQLLLAVAESRYDISIALDHVLDTYICDIETIEDLAIKAESLARLVATLDELQIDVGIKEVFEDVYSNLTGVIDSLLNDTAEHYHVLQGTIKALAKVDPYKSLDIACQLNTEERRAKAIAFLLNSYVQLPVLKIDLNFVYDGINRITDPQIRDDTLLTVMLMLSSEGDNFKCVGVDALRLISQIDEIQDALQRCNAYCLAYNYLMSLEPDKLAGLANTLLTKLKQSWNAIDVGWNKVDAGFRIVASISENSKDKAQEYLDKTESFKQTVFLDSMSNADTYLLSLQLAIKAFSGLIPRGIDTQQDLDRLRRFIDHIPANGIKARIWVDIALLYYLQKREDRFKELIRQYAMPLLDSIDVNDKQQMEDATVSVAPALYYYHQTTAIERINRLSISAKNRAYRNICEFILRKRLLTEPYLVQPSQEYNLKYEDVVDICSILENTPKDEIIAEYVQRAAESAFRGRSKRLITREQELDILKRFRQIIETKLPDDRNIKHEGYKLVALAQVALLDRSFSGWQDIVNSARSLPNLSDRVFVLSYIAGTLPTRQSSLRDQLFEEAYEHLKKIPTIIDKTNRYEAVAIHAQRKNSAMSRKCLKEGLRLLVQNNDFNAYSQQRSFIDLAHMLIDEEFAASLASIVDDDPARQQARQNLQEQHQINKLQKNIANHKFRPNDESNSKPYYPKAAWKLWEAMNAGQVNPISTDYCRFLLQEAAEMSLDEAYPIVGVVLESMNRRYATNTQMEQVRKNLRPAFEAMLRATELAGRVVTQSTAQLNRLKTLQLGQTSDKSSAIIMPGDIEQVEQTLKEWFENNVGTYLKICDQYFGPNDLGILRVLKSVKPDCDVMILTSEGNHEKVEKPWKDTYLRYWHNEVSAFQEPPNTRVVIISVCNDSKKRSPIHDRWWLTNTGGVRIGTSLNSLGVTQISEIEILESEQAKQKEQIVDMYLVQYKHTDEKGERLKYEMFDL